MNLDQILNQLFSWPALIAGVVIAYLVHWWQSKTSAPTAPKVEVVPQAAAPMPMVTAEPRRDIEYHKSQLLLHARKVKEHTANQIKADDQARKDNAEVAKLIQAISGPGSE